MASVLMFYRIILVYFLFVLSCVVVGKVSLGQKRIISEFKDIMSSGLSLNVPFNNSREECGIRLSPVKRNPLEWHFSFTGMENSPFEGGVYHGRIVLDKKYPKKAPSVSMLTPSGRWKVNTNICLSASAYHPELWDPSWNLRTLVLSLRGFMTTNPGEIGSLERDSTLQRQLAALSRSYTCPHCHTQHCHLLSPVPTLASRILGTADTAFPLQTQGAAESPSPSADSVGTATTGTAVNSIRNRRHNHTVIRSKTTTKRKSKRLRKLLQGGSPHARLQFMRQVLQYSTYALLFGLWRYCVQIITAQLSAPYIDSF